MSRPDIVFGSAILLAASILIALALMGWAHAAGCQIKGNISRSGTKIYHLPGSSAYAKTVITERKGERWFCTEDEAAAAGWRAARGRGGVEASERSTAVPNPFK